MIFGTVEKGIFIPEQSAYTLIEFEKLEGKECGLDELKDTRSLKANSYYWVAIIKTIMDKTGDDKMPLHKMFKKRFLPPITFTWKGVEYTLEPTTRILSRDEFYEYTTQIIADVAVIGISIPPPIKKDLPDYITL